MYSPDVSRNPLRGSGTRALACAPGFVRARFGPDACDEACFDAAFFFVARAADLPACLVPAPAGVLRAAVFAVALFEAVAPRDAEAADFCPVLRAAGVPAVAGVFPAVVPLAAFPVAVFFVAAFFVAAFFVAEFFDADFFVAARVFAVPAPLAVFRAALPSVRWPDVPERLAEAASLRVAPALLRPLAAVAPREPAPPVAEAPFVPRPVDTAPLAPLDDTLSAAVRRATEPPFAARVPAPLCAARFAVGCSDAAFFAGRPPMSAASPLLFLEDGAPAVAVAVGVPAFRVEARAALDLPRVVFVMRISRLSSKARARAHRAVRRFRSTRFIQIR